MLERNIVHDLLVLSRSDLLIYHCLKAKQYFELKQKFPSIKYLEAHL